MNGPGTKKPGTKKPGVSRRVWLTVAGVVAITALLAVWALVVVWRALALVATGEAIGVLLGLAFLVLPLVALAMLAREWRLAIATQAMADELFAEGGLEIDELPRSPGGRIDKAAARDAFDAARTQAEAEPSDWRSWYRLAFAYDAAGDRGRARASLRKAARMRRG